MSRPLVEVDSLAAFLVKWGQPEQALTRLEVLLFNARRQEMEILTAMVEVGTIIDEKGA